MVAALHTAENLSFGAHGRHKSGPGDSFFQYRHYMPGESVARIDWRASARTEHTYIRETEWEAAQKVYFWVDGTPSMQWRSNEKLPTKAERAQVLALALGALLLQGHEMIATLDGQLPPSRDPSSLLSLYKGLNMTKPHQEKYSKAPPQGNLPRRAHVVAVGDFILQPEETCAWLSSLSHRGTPALLVDVSDPAEEIFPYKNPTLFKGLEGEEDEAVGNPHGLREGYLKQRTQNRRLIQDTANRCGARYLTHLTNQAPEATLQKLYHLLNLKAGGRH